MKQYNIFISHSWKYNSDYYKIEKWLDDNFNWKNMSVPEHDPKTPSSNYALKREIENNIKNSTGIIILSGMYAIYSEWINTEMDIALKYNKPIIGIKPRGNVNTPMFISNNAYMVNWNSQSLFDAIRRYF